jgi:hypothetical protein
LDVCSLALNVARGSRWRSSFYLSLLVSPSPLQSLPAATAI